MTSPAPVVLHVVPGFGVDGTLRGMERVVATLVQGLERTPGWRPHLCVLRDPDPVDERHGVECPMTFFGYRGFDRDGQMARSCAAPLRRLVRAVRPSVVHSHLWPAAFTAGVALLGAGVPHVLHIHDQRAWLSSPRFRHRVRRLSQRLVMRGTHPFFIACSRATADYAAAHLVCDRARIAVVPSGIRTEELARLPAPGGGPPVVLGMAGTIAPEKGVGDALRACAELKRNSIPFRLRVAGEGSARPQFERLAAELGVAAEVEFLGAVRDMPAFYAGVDVFILPSFGEGLPLSVLEAMAAGRPVVASALPGMAEAVGDGSEGFLVPPGDAAALSAILTRLIVHPALRREMGARARERALREFSAERMVAKCVEVYERALSP